MDFRTAVRTRLFRKYSDFKGRASRSEFWWFVLFGAIVNSFLGIFSNASPQTGMLASGIVTLMLLLPHLAVTARRLHDANINFALDIGDLEHPYSQFLPFDLLRMNVAEIQHPRWSQCLEEARMRNIPLLAYRVENEAQVHALSQQRIDYLQGYAVRDIITLEIPTYRV